MSTGWVCPRCGRVYGPNVMGCNVCNNRINAPTPLPTIPYPPITPWIEPVVPPTTVPNPYVPDIYQSTPIIGDPPYTGDPGLLPKITSTR